MSGQVTNQNVSPLPPPQMQASTGGGPPPNRHIAEPELLRARACLRDQIITMLMQKSVQPLSEAHRQKVNELAIRLEDGLFKAAQTKDEFLNLSTLESRLSNLIRRPTMNSHNQRHGKLFNSSPPTGNMIPTPGYNIAPISVNSGDLLSTGGGTLSNGYQQSPATFSISSGGNMPSMGVHRMPSQMISIPGFKSGNNNNNNQSYMNMESASTGGDHPLNQHIAEPELLRARAYLRDQIITILMQKSVQPINEAQRHKVKELTIRLEDGLFKAAQTKDEFLNLSTLESRICNLIRRPTVNIRNQRHVQLVSSSAPMGNMIPTPGMQQNVNSNMMVSSVDTTILTLFSSLELKTL